MRIDLHLHTNHSDGNWSPAALVSHAVQQGMNVIAITDHDTVSGIAEAEAALQPLRGEEKNSAQSRSAARLEIIPGIEINSVWFDPNGEAHDIHILGYYLDRYDSGLQSLLARQREARIEQVEEMIEKLRQSGLAISLSMVQERAGTSSIGKVHVTQAIVTAGGAKDVSEAYSKYYGRHSPFRIVRRSVTPFEAVKAIHGAGGVCSIAHPGEGAYAEELIRELQSNGLDSIEVYHRMHSEETIAKLNELATQLGLLVTGGSDCHGPFGEHESLMGTIRVPEDSITKLKGRAKRYQ